MHIQKPPSWVVLNKQHPHARGLKAIYLMNNYRSSIVVDSLGKNNATLSNAVWVPNGVSMTGSYQRVTIDNTQEKVINGSKGTIVLYIKSLSLITDGSTRGLLGRNITNGGILLRKESNGNIFFYLNDTGSWRSIGIEPSSVPNWTKGTLITISYDANNFIFDSKKMAISVDGRYITPAFSTNPNSLTSYTMSTPIAIGNVALAYSYFLNGVIEFCSVYNDVLSESMLRDIHLNRYAMFDDNVFDTQFFYEEPNVFGIGGNGLYDGLYRGLYKGIL